MPMKKKTGPTPTNPTVFTCRSPNRQALSGWAKTPLMAVFGDRAAWRRPVTHVSAVID